jgi:hypothetical protein
MQQFETRRRGEKRAEVSRGTPRLSPAASRGSQSLLALQRQAGNAAVARLIDAQDTAVQRCGPVPCDCEPAGTGRADQVIQRDGPAATSGAPVAPAPQQVARPHLIGPLLDEWRAAGLLDPPYRPADVAPIPSLPPTTEQAAGDRPGAPVTPGLVGPPPRPTPPTTAPGPAPAPTRAPTSTPAPGPAPVPEPPPIPPWLVGVAVFIIIVLLTPTETAPPWMDELSPITGGPYASPQEYRWTRELSEPQRDYLRHLVRSRRIKPDPALDGDIDPRVLPQPEPQPRRRRAPACFTTDTPRLGGHARHDAYATKVTGTPSDYFVRTPESLKINYDGLQRPTTVWEVKVGFGWFFNPESAAVRDVTLARWDAQKDLGLAVAGRCGYVHLWAHPDRHVARLVTTRWGGVPPVLNIPE